MFFSSSSIFFFFINKGIRTLCKESYLYFLIICLPVALVYFFPLFFPPSFPQFPPLSVSIPFDFSSLFSSSSLSSSFIYSSVFPYFLLSPPNFYRYSPYLPLPLSSLFFLSPPLLNVSRHFDHTPIYFCVSFLFFIFSSPSLLTTLVLFSPFLSFFFLFFSFLSGFSNPDIMNTCHNF
ncbi:unnamed protein product [Acanthosepion pharaonis]|uniref:Uncharacterized protein n=1 Tax=Acanthosepion pharaonis TaxID=158019 RepID=A0A812EMY0_ACAPH|nr:unnamed protein product [Sepia pharaonis]